MIIDPFSIGVFVVFKTCQYIIEADANTEHDNVVPDTSTSSSLIEKSEKVYLTNTPNSKECNGLKNG